MGEFGSSNDAQNVSCGCITVFLLIYDSLFSYSLD